jgi:hypothetical protein
VKARQPSEPVRDAQTIAEFFAGQELPRQIFDSLAETVAVVGPAKIRVTKSQVAFSHRHTFAWAWMPGMYLRGIHAPLVLSVALRRRDVSARWKEIVEPRPGRFMHHLELYSLADVDDDVHAWLREAWAEAL